MIETVNDKSGPITVSSVTQVTAYNYPVRPGSVLIITGCSIFADTNFQSLGRIQTVIGQISGSIQGVGTEVQLSGSFDIPFPPISADPRLWAVIQGGQSVKVLGRVTSGSGVLNVALDGFLMDANEYNTFLNEAVNKEVMLRKLVELLEKQK